MKWKLSTFHEHKSFHIKLYLEKIDELQTLLDEDKFELFCELLNHDVDEDVAAVFIKAPLDEDDLATILQLIQEGTPSDEALKEILYHKRQNLEILNARKNMKI